MHDNVWKNNSFKSAKVSMLGHGCDASIYHQFYDRIDRRSKMILHHYSNFCVGTKGNGLLEKKWLINMVHEAEYFIWKSIDYMRDVSYWGKKRKYMPMVIERIPKKCRIGNTCFFICSSNCW